MDMKKLTLLGLAGLFLAACTQSNSSTDENSLPTSITWIEDKPGPTMQDRNLFPAVPDSLWEALGLQDGIPSAMGCFLLEADGHKILVDAGLGAPFSQLMPKLEEAGMSPDDVELIYITHMHPDHIGGMLKGDTLVFPNADVYINRVEAEAWQQIGQEQASLQQIVLAAYKDRLHLFEAGDTLQGGVVSMAAYGHTPGHTVFQKDSILIIADLMHGAALQTLHPEFCPRYDMDPEAAIDARIRIMKYARENNLTMYGMHIPGGKLED